MRNLLCLFLSLALAVQSGCYSARIARSVEKTDLEATHLFASLSEGQRVRVFTYHENRTALEMREGRILRIREDTLIIRHFGHQYSIPVDNIYKIEVLDQKRDVKRILLATALIGITLTVTYVILFFYSLSQFGK